MKLDKKALVELAGMLTVTASLVFVGMQLMLDRRVAVAEQYFNRAESVKEDRRTKMTSDAYLQFKEEAWALGRRPHYWNEDWELAKLIESGDISVRSLFAMEAHYELAVIGYDNLHFQYEQGLLEEEKWLQFRVGIKERLIDEPELLRTIFVSRSRASLAPVIEEILFEIENGK